MTPAIVNQTPNHFYSLHLSCVDFISELPFDLVPLIMKHFSAVELFHLFNVSKVWKARLLSCCKLWSRVTIFRAQLNIHVLTTLASVAPHVEHLGLSFVISGDMYTRVLHLLERGIFVKLEHLEINGFFSDCAISKNTRLLPALHAVSNTLKQFKLSSNSSDVSFETVVSTCQQLEHFWWCVTDSSIVPDQDFYVNNNLRVAGSNVRNITLTHLIVDAPSVHISFLQSLVILCPNIRRLSIGMCSFSEALDIIRQSYGNQLEYLSYNPETPNNTSKWLQLGYKTIIPATTTSALKNNTGHSLIRSSQGLRHLELYGHSEIGFILFLSRHTATIENLHIKGKKHGNSSISREDDLPRIHRTFQRCIVDPFLNLCTLVICHYTHNPQIIAMLLSRASVSLQEICFSVCDLKDSTIFESIRKFRCLKRLVLGDKVQANYSDILGLMEHFATTNKSINKNNNNDDDDDIDSTYCFNNQERRYQQQQQKQQKIHCIHLCGEEMVLDDIIIRELAKIETLREIKINNAKQVTEQGMDEFCKLLRQRDTYLCALEVNTIIRFTDREFGRLSTTPVFEKRSLRDRERTITREALVEFSDRIKTYK
ncbi:hypothetical protein BDA99DRAFT_542905 [Phascolomyces articulosus]|uniref:F-box domain-containing protein n=1 Tax=Phascolomyces articulosus TaxID=60185 RepID=A0AAD5JP76_9FUNG|nr:hypothetical protein BDA99DRAFT_542905 [Phascolomyces articulosus]